MKDLWLFLIIIGGVIAFVIAGILFVMIPEIKDGLMGVLCTEHNYIKKDNLIARKNKK